VIHAEMDTSERDVEEHTLYVSRQDNTPTTREQRTDLRKVINDLYLSHQASGFGISVLPLRGETETSVLDKARAVNVDGGATALGPSSSLTSPLAERTKAAKISPPSSPAKTPAKTSDMPNDLDVGPSAVDVAMVGSSSNADSSI